MLAPGIGAGASPAAAGAGGIGAAGLPPSGEVVAGAADAEPAPPGSSAKLAGPCQTSSISVPFG